MFGPKSERTHKIVFTGSCGGGALPRQDGVKPVAAQVFEGDLFVPNKFQVSNESLILAQNQRWRRA
jgi:hypothetical protein